MAATALAGCVSVPELITHPRELSPIDADSRTRMEQSLGLPRQAFHSPEGPMISWLRVDPAARGFEYEVHRGPDGIRFEMRTAPTEPEPLPGHGTVVWVHGWGMDGGSLMPWALRFGELGYTSVVVDLRNHGFSGRAPAGYGVRESADVVALVRHLLASDAVPRPVFLAGTSLGGSTALLAGPQLYPDIAGVITLAPFANAGESIRSVLRNAAAPGQSGLFRRLRSAWLHRQITGSGLDALVAEAGARLEIDLDAVDIGTSIAASRTCAVQLHGIGDRVIPIESARRIARGNPRIQLHELPHDNHLTIALRVDWLAAPLASWMEAVVATPDQGCPMLRLPPDPLAGSIPSGRAPKKGARPCRPDSAPVM